MYLIPTYCTKYKIMYVLGTPPPPPGSSQLYTTQDHGARYMVAVLDKETNEMSLHPSSLINLKPYITSYEEEQGGPLSYGERYKNLAMTFGDSRIRKTIRGRPNYQIRNTYLSY